MNAIERRRELTVGAVILAGIRSKLIDGLEAGAVATHGVFAANLPGG